MHAGVVCTQPCHMFATGWSGANYMHLGKRLAKYTAVEDEKTPACFILCCVSFLDPCITVRVMVFARSVLPVLLCAC